MKLTPDQRASVKSSAQHRLLVAGPGTGKSATILGFLQKAITDDGVPPDSIFILTFTRAATAELQCKVAEFVTGSSRPVVSTLHGFALRQVLKNAKSIQALPTDFVVANDYDERRIVYEDLKRFLGKDIRDIRKLFSNLSSNWETLAADGSGWQQEFPDSAFIGAWQEHRAIYGYALRSELVYQFKRILEEEDAPRVDGPITYLIVDEYQDLNRCDLRVVNALSKLGARLFCAGDDDQSIYGFRNANPQGIRGFQSDYPSSARFVFTECFRCGPNILQVANQVIKQDYRRIDKPIQSRVKSAGEVHLLHYSNQEEEARSIAALISTLGSNRGVPMNEILILLRGDHNHAFSRVIEKALVSAGIPILKSESEFEVLSSDAGHYFAALMRLLANPKHDLALRTILDLTNGIGPATIDALYNIARSEQRRFAEVCLDVAAGRYESNSDVHRARKTLQRIQQIEYDKLRNEDDFDVVIRDLLQLVPKSDESFRSSVTTLVESQGISSLEEFLNLLTDINPNNEQDFREVEAVRIMTMHKAKGLSADAVFLVGVEDEYLPGRQEVDESRRLLYVSLTRAKQYLFMTYCSQRYGQQARTGSGQSPRRSLSRFLAHLNVPIVQGRNFALD